MPITLSLEAAVTLACFAWQAARNVHDTETTWAEISRSFVPQHLEEIRPLLAAIALQLPGRPLPGDMTSNMPQLPSSGYVLPRLSQRVSAKLFGRWKRQFTLSHHHARIIVAHLGRFAAAVERAVPPDFMNDLTRRTAVRAGLTVSMSILQETVGRGRIRKVLAS